MISPFEYVSVLVSIILGMGITQLVSGLTAIIIRWEKVKVYWPHMMLILLVFIIHIQDWWALYEMVDYQYWRLPMFLFIILYPINLYILTRILFPIRWAAKEIDLKKFYYDNARKIYLFMSLLPLHSIIDNHFIGDYAIEDQALQFVIFLVLSATVLFNWKKEWIHKTIVVGFLLILCLVFAVGWNELIISSH